MRTLIAALALLASQATAQDAAQDAAQTMQDCDEMLAAAVTLSQVPVSTGPVKVTPEGWCRVTGIVIADDGPSAPVIEADVLEWRGTGLADLVAGTGLPGTVEARVKGLRQSIATSGVMGYVLRAQRARLGIDGTLALRWEAGENVLYLDGLTLDFPGDNSLRAQAVFAGLDLGDLERAQVSVMTGGVTDVSLLVEANGLFETLLLAPLANVLLSDDDPAAEAEALKAMARAEIAALPETVFDAESRAALAVLVDDMPTPWGRFELSLRAAEPVGAPRFMRFVVMGGPMSREDFWEAFAGVILTVRYLPTPR